MTATIISVVSILLGGGLLGVILLHKREAPLFEHSPATSCEELRPAHE